jgi:hypothetical protein
MSDDTQTPAKKPYATPKLVTYGSITSLTKASKLLLGKADGGGKLKTKSRVR